MCPDLQHVNLCFFFFISFHVGFFAATSCWLVTAICFFVFSWLLLHKNTLFFLTLCYESLLRYFAYEFRCFVDSQCVRITKIKLWILSWDLSTKKKWKTCKYFQVRMRKNIYIHEYIFFNCSFWPWRMHIKIFI